MVNLAPAVTNVIANAKVVSDDAWRATFIEYYETNAPSKVAMVNQKMMDRFRGKYDVLMENLIKKYGPLGEPIAQRPASAAGAAVGSRGGAGAFSSAPGSTSVHDHSLKFKAMIQQAAPTLPPRDGNLNVVASKASNSQHGLETSTFTVCTRVRPLLGSEAEGNYAAVVPGQRTAKAAPSTGGSSDNYTEELLLLTPKLTITGKAKLDTVSFDFDYVFGPDSTNEEIYHLACAPLVQRALNGQVGVIFAYGQTGSGKTHTISGILEILSASAIFGAATTLSFSYLEMLGREIRDCVPAEGGAGDAPGPAVQIGEGLDGGVLVRHLTTHAVADAARLGALLRRAHATRATASTSKNATSSRSHGVAVLRVKNKRTGVEGTLYVIDLAGSESAKDSKDHDKERMKETKEINSSLMSLKSCIRARTAAAGIGQGGTHIPFRNNKLTLLIKDIFDVSCSRLCSTVVIATCSPLVSDISHTKNTVKYAAPLRVAVAKSTKNLEVDVLDPALWDNPKMSSWVESVAPGKIDGTVFLNSLSGVQFCGLSENEFYERAEAQATAPGDEEAMRDIARAIYLGLWTLIVDAKTRKRRPDGSIITPAQEEEERRVLEENTLERARVWSEREKHM